MVKKIILIFLCVVLGIVALMSVGGAVYLNRKLNKIQVKELDTQDIETEEVGTVEVPVDEYEEAGDYTTIVVFGLDNRNLGSLDKGLSDVIMIVSIDNDTKEMKMVSVYRDTYLNTSPGNGDAYQKCNAAYSYGGASRAVNMLSANLDLKIDDYVTVNFRTVADCVDAVGGVDIDITSYEELKWLNFYIEHTNEIMKTKAPAVSGTGVHRLNGIQAVAYGRIRYTAGGDFSRAQRHRIVLSQLFKQVKGSDMSTINEILDIVCPEVLTSLSKEGMLKLIGTVLTYDLADTRGFPFERNTTTLPKAGSVVVPCDLETNVKELHEFLYGNPDYQPSENIVNYSKTIINNTGFTVDSAMNDKYINADDAGEPEADGEIIEYNEEDEINYEELDDGYVE